MRSAFSRAELRPITGRKKYKHLQVEPIHGLSVNSALPEVAEQMAINVAHLFQSDWAVVEPGEYREQLAAAFPQVRCRVFLL